MQKIAHEILNTLGRIIKRKILLIPPHAIAHTHATKSSAGFWYCGNLFDTSDIAYGISVNGIVEKEETGLVQRILKQLGSNFTFLDIGANTGYYGIMSAFLYPASKTYSFEPIKAHSEMLRESVYLNRLENIDISEFALGNTEEHKDIYTAGSGTTLIKDFTTNTNNKISIQIRKLDDVMQEKNVAKIDFIKIDVEGFEFEVLEGAKKSIESSKPILFVEICHTKDGRDGLFSNQNFNKTIDFVEKIGYKSHILGNAGLQEFKKNSIPPKGVWMFLFIHPENHGSIIL